MSFSELHNRAGDDSRSRADAEAAELWTVFVAQEPGEAFARLYEQYRSDVARYCRGITEDRHLAEDVADQAFIRLWVRRPTIRSTFRVMLLGVARNLCRDAMRGQQARGRHVRVVDDTQLAAASTPRGSTDPAEASVQAEETTALRRCLSQLSERERGLVVLTQAMDVSQREAAEVLNIHASAGNVSRLLQRALRRLRECLRSRGV